MFFAVFHLKFDHTVRFIFSEAIKYSFAMQHSEEGVKKYANYIAGDNNKGAVVAEIKKRINFEVKK